MKKIENKKLPQMLSFNMCEGPKKIWHHFGLFLSLFSAFHLKFLQLCKKPQSYICGTHQLLFPLVNNAQNWCQKLWRIFSPLLILQGECVYYVSHLLFSIAIRGPPESPSHASLPLSSVQIWKLKNFISYNFEISDKYLLLNFPRIKVTALLIWGHNYLHLL